MRSGAPVSSRAPIKHRARTIEQRARLAHFVMCGMNLKQAAAKVFICEKLATLRFREWLVAEHPEIAALVAKSPRPSGRTALARSLILSKSIKP